MNRRFRTASLALVVVLGGLLPGACGKPEPALPRPANAIVAEAFPAAPLGFDRRPYLPEPGPLTVLRHAPVGGTESDPQPRVRFSLPMTSLGAAEDRCGVELLRIEPVWPGRQCWESNTLLRFEPDAPFPIGNSYAVELPAGVRDASGTRELEAALRWSFESPRPQLLWMDPSPDAYDVEDDDELELHFNARMDPAALQGFVTVLVAERDRPKRVIELTDGSAQDVYDEDPNDDPNAPRYLAEHPVDFVLERHELPPYCTGEDCVLLRPKKPFPPAARVTVRLEPGYVSLEGPLPAESRFESSFTVRDEMRLEQVSCDGGVCRPWGWVTFAFSNSFPYDADTKAYLSVKPQIEWDVSSWGDRVSLYAEWQPGTEYTIRFASGLRDQYGQRLAPLSFSFTAGPYLPEVNLPSGLTVIDRRGVHGLVATLRHTTKHRAAVAVIPPEKTLAALHWLAGAQRSCTSDADCCGSECDLERGVCYSVPESCGVLPESIGRPTAVPGTSQVVLDDLELALPVAELVPDTRAGSLFYEVEVDEGVSTRGLLVLTAIGLTYRGDGKRGVVLVSDLASANPLPDIELELRAGDETLLWSGRSDAQGIAELPAPASFADALAPFHVVARQGDDQAFLPIDAGYLPQTALVGSLIADRRLYKPGERIYFKGYPRWDEVAGLRTLDGPFELSVSDGVGAVLGRQELMPNARGNVHGSFDLPDDARLGWGSVSLVHKESQRALHWSIRIAEYRAPEFEVDATPLNGDVIRGNPVEIQVTGRLLNGSPMAEAKGVALRESDEAVFYPKGPEGVTYGFIGPVIRSWPTDRESLTLDGSGENVLSLPTSTGFFPTVRQSVNVELTDVTRQTVATSTELLVHPGEFYLGARVPKPVGFSNYIIGDDFEVNFVAVRPDGSVFDELGSIRDFEMRILGPEQLPPSESDPDYAAWIANPPKRFEKSCRPEQLESVEVLGRCGVRFTEQGSWLLSAVAFDSLGNELHVDTSVSVYAERHEVSNYVTSCYGLDPDKERYAPGDTARLALCSYMNLGRALYTVDRGGLQSYFSEPVELVEGRTELAFPIATAHLPRVNLGVNAIGRRSSYELDPDGYDGHRPDWMVDQVSLEVDTKTQALDVSLTPALSTATPGSEVELRLQVRGHDGTPVAAAELTVWAVDEGVLLLEPIELPDLLRNLWVYPWNRVNYAELRTLLASRLGLTTPERVRELVEGEVLRGYGMGAGASGASLSGRAAAKMGTAMSSPPPVRSRFETTPLFVAELMTDADGNATTVLHLPDNLTRYRLFAVASAETTRFGNTESEITVNLPLMLRPALPRFAYLGDRFNAGVIVQNATDRDREVEVSVKLACEGDPSECLSVASTPLRVSVPAQRSRELPFDFEAVGLGTAVLEFTAQSGAVGAGTHPDALGDALSWRLPVQRLWLSEATAAYGRIDDAMSSCCRPDDPLAAMSCAECTTAVSIPLALPREVELDRGGLQVRMSSTALTNLADAAQYLIDYPHGCVEQTASRLLPIAVLGALGPELSGREPSELDELLRAGLARLAMMQRQSGGFTYWPGVGTVNDYASLWATLVLGELDRVGQCPAASTCERVRSAALAYVAGLALQPIDEELDLVELQSQRVDRLYALYVLNEAGRLDAQHAPMLASIAPTWAELPLFARFWLLDALRTSRESGWAIDGVDVPALEAELLQSAMNQASETARFTHFREVPLPGFWMSSEFRTDAIALDVLLRRDPSDPLLPELAQGLMAARQSGRWSTTQENGWALRALGRYFAIVEAAEPNFVAATWLGEQALTEARFEGRSGRSEEAFVPMQRLQAAADASSESALIVAKRGAGVLYYRLGLDYTPSQQDLPALDAGFALERSYTLVEGEGGDEVNERRLDEAELATVPAGAVVRVTLSVDAPDIRYFVALVDPLPAGFEPIDPANKTTRAEGNRFYDYGGGFGHREYFDDRVALYADVLYPGVRVTSYRVRATTPGEFWAAPPKIEEMYAPEVFGRDHGLSVTVER